LEARIDITDRSFYFDVFSRGALGAAESYIQGKWETPDLNSVMQIFALNKAAIHTVDSGPVSALKPLRLFKYWQQRNTVRGAKKNSREHYDLPDELFRLFLDESMNYSSAFFVSDTNSLEQAQQDKM